MIRYIILTLAFQLVFLLIYDLFLKRETFFQWNRTYLIGSFALSLMLPFIKLEVFTTVVPQEFSAIVLPEIVMTTENVAQTNSVQISWLQLLFVTGAFVALVLFGYKMYQLLRLWQLGKVERLSDFIKVVIPESTLAFSFNRTVFLGEEVSKKDEVGILRHELVHIKQKHTLDLLFFELMRIAFWFNPLVYIYQSRISELHEFIADSHTGKNNRKEQYELLLAQVFQTKNISFINHFYKSSLIKRRIVMLQKSKSNQVLKFKYLLMLPLVAGMLFYTSCETRQENAADIEEIVEQQRTGMIEEVVIVALSDNASKSSSTSDDELIELVEEIPISTHDKKVIEGKIIEKIPFSEIEEVPIFPGCENAVDKEKCFNDHMIKHVKKNFRYPEEAVKAGVQGRVNVVFSIKKDGTVGDLRLKGPSKDLELEAKRIISKLPKMSPGKHKGKEVSVPYNIPITFKLAQK